MINSMHFFLDRQYKHSSRLPELAWSIGFGCVVNIIFSENNVKQHYLLIAWAGLLCFKPVQADLDSQSFTMPALWFS
jgi:hypothetical protein